MKLLSLRIDSRFRNLDKGFEIQFHQLDKFDEMTDFNPFCLVGLNGCGKSNILEALAQIFYHIELCVGKHLPKVLRQGAIFNPRQCAVNAFTLKYLALSSEVNSVSQSQTFLVTISKKDNVGPIMTVMSKGDAPMMKFDLDNVQISLSSLIKSFLPQYVVAYSSGENETLSIPFIKSRFIHLFEFQENVVNDVVDYSSPENSLIYVDANMSQAILLCCLLFEDKSTLSSLADYKYTGILSVKKFRMHLREQTFKEDGKHEYSYFKLFTRKLHDAGGIDKSLFEILKDISTISWYDESDKSYYFDFWVDEATKEAFKYYFHTAMDCFQMFRLLYELNNYGVTLDKQREIFGSTGVYTDGKFGTPGSDDDVFHFLDFYLVKKLDEQGDEKELLLKEFSDGEHQFIHTMAICLLLKDSDSLILLDEPETHFNPSWRSHFVSILDETLRNACLNLKQHDGRYVNFMKDVLITTHSPFIISDCQADNVIIVKKDGNHAKAEKASDLGIKTYGASTSFIQAKIFGSTDTIGGKAYGDMVQMGKKENIDKDDLMDEINETFGESMEKMIVLGKIRRENNASSI